LPKSSILAAQKSKWTVPHTENQTMNATSIMFMAPEMFAVEHAEQLPERCHPKNTDV
jgi:hypothetical protein